MLAKLPLASAKSDIISGFSLESRSFAGKHVFPEDLGQLREVNQTPGASRSGATKHTRTRLEAECTPC